MAKQTRCAICGGRLDPMRSNNGEPLAHGKVCMDCNMKVIAARLIKAMTANKEENNER